MNAEVDISNVTLKTERLVLRPWKLSDVDDMFEYASDKDVGPMAGWSPHKDKEESLSIIERFIAKKRTFAVEFNGKVIGSLGIECYEEEELPEFKNKKGREIGCVLSKEYWGRGLMPEAIKEVMKYCFEVLKLDFLAYSYFHWNHQSKRVCEKCGFTFVRNTKRSTPRGTVEDNAVHICLNNR